MREGVYETLETAKPVLKEAWARKRRRRKRLTLKQRRLLREGKGRK